MSERSRDTEATLVKKPHVLMGYLSVRAQMQVYIVQGESKIKMNKRGEIHDYGYSGEMARPERLRVH